MNLNTQANSIGTTPSIRSSTSGVTSIPWINLRNPRQTGEATSRPHETAPAFQSYLRAPFEHWDEAVLGVLVLSSFYAIVSAFGV
jgi:hypothetical protein